MSPRPKFCFENEWVFEVPPDTLWAAIARVDQYPKWFSALRDFESDGLHPGAVTKTAVQSPLGYSIKLEITTVEAHPGRHLFGEVAGDISGTIDLRIDTHPKGCRTKITFDVEVKTTFLKLLSGPGHQSMGWGHNFVMKGGVRRFRERALGIS